MAKKNKKNALMPTKGKSLIDKMNDAKEEDLLKEEKTQLIIQEYEEKLKDLEKKEKEIEKEEERIKKAEKEKVEEILSKENEIKKDFFAGREKESQEIIKKARIEADSIVQKVERELLDKKSEINKEINAARIEAHSIKLETENKKAKILKEAQENIEKMLSDINNNNERKMQELIEKELAVINSSFSKDHEYKKRLHELELFKSDLEFEVEILNDEKDRANQLLSTCSPIQMEALNDKYETEKMLRDVDRETIKDLRKEIIKMRSLLPDDDISQKDILFELHKLKTDNLELRDVLSGYPSKEEIQVLREKNNSLESIKLEYEDLKLKYIKEKDLTDRLAMSTLELEQTKRTAEFLKALNEQLQEEMEASKNLLQQKTSSRFEGLMDIDNKLSNTPEHRFTDDILDLSELVEYIRNYGAINERLYYSRNILRAFIASLAATKLIILQGLSGTGKSSLPRLFYNAIGGEMSLISVQPSWRDNKELLGYDNDFTKKFKETEFTKKMYEASAPINRQKPWLMVLDEMNLARIEYYFADFLSIMEQDSEKWIIPLVSNKQDEANTPMYLVDGTSLMVSENIWFIGTANRDESTFGITDKVYDRAQVIDFNDREKKFEVPNRIKRSNISYAHLIELIEDAVCDSNFKLKESDWNNVEEIDEFLKTSLGITFGNRIKNQMERFVPVYVACGGTKEDAIDFQLAHKVLRKLENRYESHLLNSLKEFKEMLKIYYPNSTFAESIKIINKQIDQLGG